MCDYRHTCTRTHMHAYTHACVHTCAHRYRNTDAYTHTHEHMQMHTYCSIKFLGYMAWLDQTSIRKWNILQWSSAQQHSPVKHFTLNLATCELLLSEATMTCTYTEYG